MEGAIMATKQQIPTLVGELVKNQVCLEHMPVEDAQWVIQNPEVALSLFVTAVVNRGKQLVVQVTTQIVKKTLTVWKKISVGGTTTEDLLKAINAKKNEIGNRARDLTTKAAFVIAVTPSQAGLVVLTPANLGFTSPPCTDAFMTKEFCADWSAKNLDGWVIELCEIEDGPQLRDQYQDQPKDELLWLAMERITDSDGYPSVLGVKHRGDGELWLVAGWALPNDAWFLGARFVFRLRKIPSPSAT